MGSLILTVVYYIARLLFYFWRLYLLLFYFMWCVNVCACMHACICVCVHTRMCARMHVCMHYEHAGMHGNRKRILGWEPYLSPLNCWAISPTTSLSLFYAQIKGDPEMTMCFPISQNCKWQRWYLNPSLFAWKNPCVFCHSLPSAQ